MRILSDIAKHLFPAKPQASVLEAQVAFLDDRIAELEAERDAEKERADELAFRLNNLGESCRRALSERDEAVNELGRIKWFYEATSNKRDAKGRLSPKKPVSA